MNDGREKEMKHVTKLGITIITGVLALLFEFILQQPNWAYGIILITGSVMALMMFWEMIQTLREGKYGVDILAITAIVATLAVGEYWASLMILIMLTGGDSLEDYAAGKANQELKSLLDNSPQKAHRLNGENLEDVSVEEINVGDELVVKPGELVPVDGLVKTGTSTVDESSLTGESKPIEKNPGDELMSGSVNGDGSLKMVAEKTVADSQYQTIVNLVKESAARPAHFVRLADRYAVPFTLVAYLIAGIAWFVSKSPTRFAEVLVVASPCPLILSAPIALVAGMGRSSRHGVVIKSGTMVEKLASAKTIAFDKTGTITKGQLSVDQVQPINAEITAAELVGLVASVEQESSHILARSIVAYARKQDVPLKNITNLAEVSGAGVKAFVDGAEIRVGKKNFVTQDSETTEKIDKTTIHISRSGTYLGRITFMDTVRPEAKETMEKLQQMHLQRILMLTGDQESVAETIAAEVGITEVHGECLPQDKLTILEELPKENHPVIMVGDGVNDAPSLAAADVGIAMGAHGATAASETADVVILQDDLSKVSQAVEIAQDTMKIAKQSVLIGIFICVLLMLIASTGIIPALFGAMLQEVVDTVSILSALRARRIAK
ncbi:heavy metal translocating P-type ATPase [Enterococcus faecalis]|uniref:heavy metal translocating P-type ATPase n=1 Tax=Enterococcus faecalis TaxID=1351 RepID=UPI0013B05398|nr:heavy metal translocating P-type ATPase [Enterococcus faecalis]EGO8274104.1 cadmium-translocating P-type ATPase [Enterococcus faecalis]MDB1622665.1 heavy metal translocating P-type ATPase [Enterococcus faecalis]NSW11831.1 cadmium-translocating P-type ATPase [Enterococcus faecalis]